MKKRVLMILLIVVSILLIPRYNGSNTEIKNSQGNHHLYKKPVEEPDELDVPFLGIWSVYNMIPKSGAGSRDISHIPASTLAHKTVATNNFTGLWVYHV